MREFKFRVRFGSGVFYYFSMNQQWTDAMITAHSNAVLNGLHFEQFTGLHDKNGKEIYEGDLIRNSQTEWVETQPGEVFLYDGCWCFDCFHAQALELGGHSDNVVVGNIHENPELLK